MIRMAFGLGETGKGVKEWGNSPPMIEGSEVADLETVFGQGGLDRRSRCVCPVEHQIENRTTRLPGVGPLSRFRDVSMGVRQFVTTFMQLSGLPLAC